MIQIITNNRNPGAYLLRDDIRRCCIPCAITDFSDVCDLPRSMIYITLTDDLSQTIANVDPETVLYADVTAIQNETLRSHEVSRVIGRIYDVLYIKYGICCDSFSVGGFSEYGKVSRYLGRRLYLTHTERLLVRHVASARDRWCSASEIARFCLADVDALGAVPVHINKINRKSRLISPVKMFELRRGSGYRLTVK